MKRQVIIKDKQMRDRRYRLQQLTAEIRAVFPQVNSIVFKDRMGWPHHIDVVCDPATKDLPDFDDDDFLAIVKAHDPQVMLTITDALEQAKTQKEKFDILEEAIDRNFGNQPLNRPE